MPALAAVQLHLWLDLDNTLICAMPGYFPEHLPDAVLRPEARQAPPEAPTYALYVRPGLQPLLSWLALDTRVRLGLWTAASSAYAEAILRMIGVRSCFSAVLGGEACHQGVKDLAVLAARGVPLAQTVVVDDHPERIEAHAAAVLPIAPFRADPTDRALAALSAAVEALLEGDDDTLAAAQVAMLRSTGDRWHEARGWRWVYDPTGARLQHLG